MDIDVYENLRERYWRPGASQMARMDRMIIVHLWGMCVKRNSKRARENIRIYGLREPSWRYASQFMITRGKRYKNVYQRH